METPPRPPSEKVENREEAKTGRFRNYVNTILGAAALFSAVPAEAAPNSVHQDRAPVEHVDHDRFSGFSMPNLTTGITGMDAAGHVYTRWQSIVAPMQLEIPVHHEVEK